jgi:hypothetical protein
MFNARYRNAFNNRWITPKVSTGITYNVNKSSSLYGNVGYAWKDTGTGTNPDKLDLGVGAKFNF